jgi:ABC-type thiamine transport system substrate-binding protein
MYFMTIRAVLCSLAALTASAFVFQNAGAADPALIAAAKREGEVTWYTTQITTQFGRPAADAFQKKYGIKVNMVRGDSVELAVRMLNEARAGRMQADVFDGTGGAPALKKGGVVLKWQPDAAHLLPKEYVDAEGFWVATNIYIQTPAYNTNLVPRARSRARSRTCSRPNGRERWPGPRTPRLRAPPVSSASC